MLPPPGLAEGLLFVIAVLAVGFALGCLVQQRLSRRISPVAEYAEAARQAAEDKYRAIFENAIEGIFQTTPDGSYLSANPKLAEIYGYQSPEELIESLRNIECQLYVDPCRRYEFVRLMDEHDEIIDFESQVYRRDGAIIWISENARAIRDRGGRLLRYEGTVEDITERKRTTALQAEKEAAVAANLAKSSFVAHMSHEIRTPLNGVSGMLQLVAGTKLDERQARYVQIAQTSADNLLALINDVLDFSKIEAGKLELEAIPLDLHELLEDLTESFSHRACSRGLELSCRIAPEVPAAVCGDPKRLRQVLANLVNNALKFTQRGEVALRAETAASRDGRTVVRFEVRDTGIGIAADRRFRLFAPFSQIDASTTRKYGGSGLGLAICKQLVELMGGTIGVESELGAGATFWCEIPLEPVDVPSPPRSTAPWQLRGLKLLAVDDQPMSVAVLRDLVGSWGMSVQGVARVDRALDGLRNAAASGRPFALAVLAHHPPHHDALPLARQIKSDPVLTDLPLLILTAIDTPIDREAMRAAGVAAAITKPIRQSRLLDAIVSALHMSASHISSSRAEVAESTLAPIVSANASARILVAEDNEINQLVTCEILRSAGYECDVVANGHEALAALRRGGYALVLMDCQMPELDGFAASEWIRTLESRGELPLAVSGPIPIIALTANAIAGDREHCLAAGMTDYTTKPIDRDLLLAMVQRFVASEQQVRIAECRLRNEEQPATPKSALRNPHSPVSDPQSHQAVLNRDELLSRCASDAGLASRLLAKFRSRLPESFRVIQEALEDERRDDARRLAHALKGMAANLAAAPLSAAAAQLETALMADPPDNPGPSLARLEQEATRCLDELDRMLQDELAPSSL